MDVITGGHNECRFDTCPGPRGGSRIFQWGGFAWKLLPLYIAYTPMLVHVPYRYQYLPLFMFNGVRYMHVVSLHAETSLAKWLKGDLTLDI